MLNYLLFNMIKVLVLHTLQKLKFSGIITVDRLSDLHVICNVYSQELNNICSYLLVKNHLR